MVQKFGIAFKSEATINNHPSYKHIKDKSIFRCILLLIPVLGNLIVGIYDASRKNLNAPTSLNITTIKSELSQLYQKLDNIENVKVLIDKLSKVNSKQNRNEYETIKAEIKAELSKMEDNTDKSTEQQSEQLAFPFDFNLDPVIEEISIQLFDTVTRLAEKGEIDWALEVVEKIPEQDCKLSAIQSISDKLKVMKDLKQALSFAGLLPDEEVKKSTFYELGKVLGKDEKGQKEWKSLAADLNDDLSKSDFLAGIAFEMAFSKNESSTFFDSLIEIYSSIPEKKEYGIIGSLILQQLKKGNDYAKAFKFITLNIEEKSQPELLKEIFNHYLENNKFTEAEEVAAAAKNEGMFCSLFNKLSSMDKKEALEKLVDKYDGNIKSQAYRFLSEYYSKYGDISKASEMAKKIPDSSLKASAISSVVENLLAYLKQNTSSNFNIDNIYNSCLKMDAAINQETKKEYLFFGAMTDVLKAYLEKGDIVEAKKLAKEICITETASLNLFTGTKRYAMLLIIDALMKNKTPFDELLTFALDKTLTKTIEHGEDGIIAYIARSIAAPIYIGVGTFYTGNFGSISPAEQSIFKHVEEAGQKTIEKANTISNADLKDKAMYFICIAYAKYNLLEKAEEVADCISNTIVQQEADEFIRLSRSNPPRRLGQRDFLWRE